jgi:hypothetical protein
MLPWARGKRSRCVMIIPACGRDGCQNDGLHSYRDGFDLKPRIGCCDLPGVARV